MRKWKVRKLQCSVKALANDQIRQGQVKTRLILLVYSIFTWLLNQFQFQV